MFPQHEHRARIRSLRSRGMLLRIALVLLAGIAAMILVNPSTTDFEPGPIDGPGIAPTIGELVPFGL